MLLQEIESPSCSQQPGRPHEINDCISQVVHWNRICPSKRSPVYGRPGRPIYNLVHCSRITSDTVPKTNWSLQYKGPQVFFARHGGDMAYLAYPTVAYSHVRGLRTNTYD
jgi:hypothetical protein